jgi:hypothetical protein
MSFRDEVLRAVDEARAVPTSLGIRDSRVYLRSRVWAAASGADEIGKGTLTTTDVEITPRPRVVELVGERLRIGPITPSHSLGGYSPSTLSPADVNGTDAVLAVTSPDGSTRNYQVVRVNQEPAGYSFSYFLEAEPLTEDSGSPW